jgi:hypothetical protein
MSYNNPNYEPPIKRPWYKNVNMFAAAAIVIVSILILITLIYGRYSEKTVKVEAAVQAKELGPKEDELTLDDAYAALFREYKTQKICYLEDRNGYFILFDKKDTDDDNWDGWFFLRGPTFYHIKSNKTWFLTNIPDGDFTHVWPNVDGLNCAEAKDYEGK